MSTADWLRAIGRSDLPKDWRLVSVGSRYDVQLGKMLNADRAAEPDEPGAAPYLRNVNVQWDRIDTADLKWMRFSLEDRAKYALRRGDLLVCEGGEIGRCAVWDAARDDCFFQKALMRVRPRGPDGVAWLALCLRALADGGALSAGADKSTIDHLPAEKLRALRVPLPPPESQRMILNALDAETARIDALVAARGRQRELLIARRQARLDGLLAGAPRRAAKSLFTRIEQGWSAIADETPATGADEFAVLRLDAVDGGEFFPERNKRLAVAALREDWERYRVHDDNPKGPANTGHSPARRPRSAD